MGFFLLPFVAALGAPQQLPDPGLVIVAKDSPGFAGFDLGDGGVAARRTPLDVEGPGRCVTPGGVQIHCRREGARLVFPTGRELLLAPDGYLHLRDGGVAGPYTGGVELRLGDESVVRFALSGSRRAPIREVVVRHGSDRVRLWRRLRPQRESVRATGWAGERLMCLGDGGAVYRALALGPVVTLNRQLAPRRTQLPELRLGLMVAPLDASIDKLLEDHRRDQSGEVEELRRFAANLGKVLSGAVPRPVRTKSDPLTFQLSGPYELEFLHEDSSLRMRLSRPGQAAFAEWQLGYDAHASVVEASKRTGRAFPVPVLASFEAREQRHELGAALAVFRGLRGRR